MEPCGCGRLAVYFPPLHGTQALNEHLFTRVLPGGAKLCWSQTLVSLPFSLRAQDSGFLDVCPAMLVTTGGWGEDWTAPGLEKDCGLTPV